MKKILENLLKEKSKTMPILSFPAARLIGVSVKDMVTDPDVMAKAVAAIASRGDVGVAVMPMDLSVEAECFGAEVVFGEGEPPAVRCPILDDICDASALAVPDVYTARSGIFVEGTRKARGIIPNTPIFCGAIGPFSLACRLFDMTSLMMECYDSPEEVAQLLSKVTEFITSYILAHKAAGAQGVILAEPAAGLLSPDMCEEFSSVYVKKIASAVADESFVFCYHNCGGSVIACAESIADIGADVYHFGNAIKLLDIIEKMPEGSLVMGNVDPVLLREGNPENVKKAIDAVFADCSGYENFMLSTGCDVPAEAKWENIDAYFSRVGELYV